MSILSTKMPRILLGVLVILIINGQVQTDEDSSELTSPVVDDSQPIEKLPEHLSPIFNNENSSQYFPYSFTFIKSVLEWGANFHHSVYELLENTDNSEDAESFIAEMEILASDLTHTNIVNISILNTLFALGITDLQNEVHQPDDSPMTSFYMQSVNNQFETVDNIRLCGQDQTTISNYLDAVLVGENDVQNKLNQLQTLIATGARTDAEIRTTQNFSPRCGTDFTGQQDLYYVYVELLLSEMKGLSTLAKVYTRKWLLDETTTSYAAELNAAKENFERRVKQYHEIFTKDMALVSQVVFNCDIDNPERGVNFLEVEYFSRIRILNLLHDDTDQLPPGQTQNCGQCESHESDRDLSLRTGMTMYNCKNLGHTVKVCRDMHGSSREYLWFQDPESNTLYGTEVSCPTIEENLVGYSQCPLCACSVDLDKEQINYPSTILGISVTEEIADIFRNMVVTGVRFIAHKNAIHLQIQQAKFTRDALSYTGVSWKDIGVTHDCAGTKPIEIKYEALHHNRKSIYLDDIKVPKGYVVTGLRFKLVEHSAFMLQLHATPFDMETAELNRLNSAWFDVTTNPMKLEDYNRPRMEIKIDNADDPTKATQFTYDPDSNKQIDFTHTDLKKDAGQMTVPLFDARPVEGRPLFPLGGVGLYYRGTIDHAGYITPRVYTMDMTPYLKMELMDAECLLG